MLELSFQCKYGRRQEATTTYNEFTEKKTLENWLPWNQLTKTMLCIVFFFSFAVLLTGYILWILNSSSLLCCHPIWHTHKYEDKPTKKNGVWSILFAHFLIFFFFHFSTFLRFRLTMLCCLARIQKQFKNKNTSNAIFSCTQYQTIFYNWLFCLLHSKCIPIRHAVAPMRKCCR